MKTLRQIVAELEASGVSVTYRERVDGSIIITNLDGQSYLGKGAAGNIAARQMAGESLSPALSQQMAKAFTIKGYGPSRKKASIDEETLRLLRRTQEALRKSKKPGMGTITKERVRQMIKDDGIKAARKALEKLREAAKDLVDQGRRDFLAGRMRDDSEELEDLADYVQTHGMTNPVYDDCKNILYDFEEKKISIEQCKQYLSAALGVKYNAPKD